VPPSHIVTHEQHTHSRHTHSLHFGQHSSNERTMAHPNSTPSTLAPPAFWPHTHAHTCTHSHAHVSLAALQHPWPRRWTHILLSTRVLNNEQRGSRDGQIAKAFAAQTVTGGSLHWWVLEPQLWSSEATCDCYRTPTHRGTPATLFQWAEAP
jgi:hypothetical protein